MPFILDHEGRTFEDDPDDPGGATKFGIDQRSHPDVNIHSLTEAQAVEIYWSEWQASRTKWLGSPLAEAWFDTRVNCGAARADKCFPQSYKYSSEAANSLLDARVKFYHALNRPKYLKGWLARVSDLREFLRL